MSGNAALSAARKRRASSTPNGGGGFANSPPSQSASASYYGGGSSSKNSVQGIMNQMPYPPAPRPEITIPKEPIIMSLTQFRYDFNIHTC